MRNSTTTADAVVPRKKFQCTFAPRKYELLIFPPKPCCGSGVFLHGSISATKMAPGHRDIGARSDGPLLKSFIGADEGAGIIFEFSSTSYRMF